MGEWGDSPHFQKFDPKIRTKMEKIDLSGRVRQI